MSNNVKKQLFAEISKSKAARDDMADIAHGLGEMGEGLSVAAKAAAGFFAKGPSLGRIAARVVRLILENKCREAKKGLEMMEHLLDRETEEIRQKVCRVRTQEYWEREVCKVDEVDDERFAAE